MPNKQFSERLNKELDDMGVPETTIERIEVLAKLLKIPKFKAETLLNGNAKADDAILNTLAEELEVNVEWLLGNSNSKPTAH